MSPTNNPHYREYRRKQRAGSKPAVNYPRDHPMTECKVCGRFTHDMIEHSFNRSGVLCREREIKI